MSAKKKTEKGGRHERLGNYDTEYSKRYNGFEKSDGNRTKQRDKDFGRLRAAAKTA